MSRAWPGDNSVKSVQEVAEGFIVEDEASIVNFDTFNSDGEFSLEQRNDRIGERIVGVNKE
jgi:hypothetical protein